MTEREGGDCGREREREKLVVRTRSRLEKGRKVTKRERERERERVWGGGRRGELTELEHTRMKSSHTNAERMPGKGCMAGGGGAQPAEGQPKVGEECRF